MQLDHLNNEIIYQANTDSSARVLLVSENGTNTTLYIDDIRGSFSSNNANDSILGLQSGSVGNTRVHTLTVFQKNPGTSCPASSPQIRAYQIWPGTICEWVS